MRQILSTALATAYGLAVAGMLMSIVAVAAGDASAARDHGTAPGFALVMILQQ